MAVETDETGWAQTGGHDLPFGTYAAVEVEAPEGYRLGLVDESGEETGEGASLTVTIDGEWSWKSYERDVRDTWCEGASLWSRSTPTWPRELRAKQRSQELSSW